LESDTENEATPKPSKKQASETNNAHHGVESNDKQVVDDVEDVNLPDSVNEQVLPVHNGKYSGNGSAAVQ
jgi:hypothetical protein